METSSRRHKAITFCWGGGSAPLAPPCVLGDCCIGAAFCCTGTLPRFCLKRVQGLHFLAEWLRSARFFRAGAAYCCPWIPFQTKSGKGSMGCIPLRRRCILLPMDTFSGFVWKGVPGLQSAAQALHSAVHGPLFRLCLERGPWAPVCCAGAAFCCPWTPFQTLSGKVSLGSSLLRRRCILLPMDPFSDFVWKGVLGLQSVAQALRSAAHGPPFRLCLERCPWAPVCCAGAAFCCPWTPFQTLSERGSLGSSLLRRRAGAAY